MATHLLVHFEVKTALHFQKTSSFSTTSKKGSCYTAYGETTQRRGLMLHPPREPYREELATSGGLENICCCALPDPLYEHIIAIATSVRF